jgi:hypothetical protein
MIYEDGENISDTMKNQAGNIEKSSNEIYVTKLGRNTLLPSRMKAQVTENLFTVDRKYLD